jgi:hypothetical protein
MCRLATLSLGTVLTVAGLVGGDCRADPLLQVVHAWNCDGVSERKLAQARASLGDAKELTRAKIADIRVAAMERFKEFLAGIGTLDFLIGSHYRLLDSELAVAVSDADRVAACERHWKIAYAIEAINKVRYLKGRIPIQDYMFSAMNCRDAEIRLARVRQKAGTKPPLLTPKLPPGTPRLQEKNWLEWDTRELDIRELAQAKLRAVNTPIIELLKAKRDAGRIALAERYREFLAGRGTLDYMLGFVLRFLDAERQVAGDTADAQAAYYEAYWLQARQAELIDKARFEAGRIPVQDYTYTRYFRLDAQIGLLRTPAKEDKGVHRALVVFEFDHTFLFEEIRDVAKEWRAVRSANVDDLLRERKEAAATEYSARANEFLAGRGTLDFLHDSTVRYRDAELAVAKQHAERRAILERHWARCKTIEAVNKARYDACRIPIQDYRESCWYRVDAEIDLVRALARK